MSSMQCHKPTEKPNHCLQKSHSTDKCHDKHQSGGAHAHGHGHGHGLVIGIHKTHDKHQAGAHGHGHGNMTLTDKVKEAVNSASKILSGGSHTKPAGQYKPKAKGLKKKTHKNSDCSDGGSSSSSSDSESDCNKPKRKNNC